jgi:hypothetical protein
MLNHHLRAVVLPPRLTVLLGEGEGDSYMDTQQLQDAPEHHTLPQKQFAPSGLHARLHQRLGQPLMIAIPKNGPVARIQHACSVCISRPLGYGELIEANARIRNLSIRESIG